MKYFNGTLTAERPTTPPENRQEEEREFDYEAFGGTYSAKHFPVEQAGSRTVVVRTKPYVRPKPCTDCGLNPCPPEDHCAECGLPLCHKCACAYDTIPMCSQCSLVHVVERRKRVAYRHMIERRHDALRQMVEEVA